MFPPLLLLLVALLVTPAADGSTGMPLKERMASLPTAGLGSTVLVNVSVDLFQEVAHSVSRLMVQRIHEAVLGDYSGGIGGAGEVSGTGGAGSSPLVILLQHQSLSRLRLASPLTATPQPGCLHVELDVAHLEWRGNYVVSLVNRRLFSGSARVALAANISLCASASATPSGGIAWAISHSPTVALSKSRLRFSRTHWRDSPKAAALNAASALLHSLAVKHLVRYCTQRGARIATLAILNDLRPDGVIVHIPILSVAYPVFVGLVADPSFAHNFMYLSIGINANPIGKAVRILDVLPSADDTNDIWTSHPAFRSALSLP